FLLGYGIVGAILAGLFAALVIRGLASWIKRYLVLSDRLAEEENADKRTLETNRYIFWRRLLIPLFLIALYMVGAYMLFGLGPVEALVLLPSLLLQLVLTVGQLLIFMLANFAIFFGPFLLFGKMGRQTLSPGDANYDGQIEYVHGQKSAIDQIVRKRKLMEHGRKPPRRHGRRRRHGRHGRHVRGRPTGPQHPPRPDGRRRQPRLPQEDHPARNQPHARRPLSSPRAARQRQPAVAAHPAPARPPLQPLLHGRHQPL